MSTLQSQQTPDFARLASLRLLRLQDSMVNQYASLFPTNKIGAKRFLDQLGVLYTRRFELNTLDLDKTINTTDLPTAQKISPYNHSQAYC